MYTTPDEAAMVIDALSSARKSIAGGDVLCAVIVDGGYSGSAPDNVVVLQGAAPGPAKTYVLDAMGRVALETLGMPPASAFTGTPPV
jgi:hypothetical protein